MEQKWIFSYLPLHKDRSDVSFEESEEHLVKQVACKPDSSELLWRLAAFYNRNKLHEEAARCICRVLLNAKGLEQRAVCLMGLGFQLECMGDWEEAVKKYRAAMQLEPAQPMTWFSILSGLGGCLNRLGQFADAERYCRFAVDFAPVAPDAYRNLGIALEAQERFREAGLAYVSSFRANALDVRSLFLLEGLVAFHEELAIEFERQLWICRAAHDLAKKQQQKVIAPPVELRGPVARTMDQILKNVRSLFSKRT